VSVTLEHTEQPASPRTATAPLLSIAAFIALLHLFTNDRYGFHRDEFQFLSDARHLDWGFVAYPPLTPFLEHLGLSFFGISLIGLRLFSVLAQAFAILIAGLMARELGGGRLAQITAALTVALSPLPLFEGTEFQYSSFDYLWWMLTAYCIIRLLKTDNPRWWLAIGAALGLGLQTKYSIIFFITGILGALALTRARRYFLSGWFWAGVAVTLAIFLPNFLWLLRHDFISYRFLQHIHIRDVSAGRAEGFLRDQVLICVNLVAAPLWLLGLVAYLRNRRYRLLGWMYLIPLTLFFLAKGRGYYLAAAYPMLLAMGAVAAEQWLASLAQIWRRTVIAVFFTGFAVCSLYICALIVPLASSGSLREFALARNGDLREELGWDTMLQSISQVRNSLPAEQQSNLGIVVGNYGENGAIELLGSAYHLPPPISGTNSAWLHGYPQSQPTTNIVLGVSDRDREMQFTACRLAAHIPYPKDQNNEESNYNAEIYVCGPPRLGWPELWKIALSFG
jgi:4-amino-4-deoxy-L-arabinose transferase-like glycosyltransferase